MKELKIFESTPIGKHTAEMMLQLINELEAEVIKLESEPKGVVLPSDEETEKPIIKNSGGKCKLCGGVTLFHTLFCLCGSKLI
tara:strand:- start:7 stop:255 length:249 start_codon:yes stop_codon:yes gene_type:complete